MFTVCIQRSKWLGLFIVVLQCYLVCGQVVVLTLGDTRLDNNSVVVITDIGDRASSGSSLICTTPYTPCCATPPNRHGEWYYPNGTRVPISGNGYSFYRSRGDNGTVHLSRRNDATTPTGFYHCILPDVNGHSQTLYVEFVDATIVFLYLGHARLDNNSAVAITDIGDRGNGGSSLVCTTTYTPCCQSSPNRHGEWYYPNGTRVPILAAGLDFYRDRGDDGTIHLSRRNNATTPTGLYHCMLPDANGHDQTLYVNVNRNNVAQITSISFRLLPPMSDLTPVFSLTCTSMGGLVAEVTWTRDGTELTNTGPLVLEDRMSFIYHNELRVTGNLPGTYKCHIKDNSDSELHAMDRIIEAANTPTNVQAVRMSTTQPVNISWSPPVPAIGKASVTGYRIYYLLGGVMRNVSVSVSARRYSLDLSGGLPDEECVLIQTKSAELPSELVNVLTILSIASSGSSIFGELYQLNCTVIGAKHLPTFTWTGPSDRNDDTIRVLPVMSSGSIYSSVVQFDQLELSHEGMYTCQVAIEGAVAGARSTQVNVELPINIIGGTPVVKQNYSLNCSVTGIGRYLHNPRVTYLWFKDNTLVYSNSVNRQTQSTLFFPETLSLSDEGLYRCNVTVRSPSLGRPLSNSSEFVLQIPLQLIFRGVSYPNNSVLPLNDLGEYTSGSAILCTTNRRPCCHTHPNRFGDWYYPRHWVNYRPVHDANTNNKYYTSRTDNRTIYLNRRGTIQYPTGSYCCELPDNLDVTHRLCVELINTYVNSYGINIAGERYQLNCTSNGTISNPSFTWRRPANNRPILPSGGDDNRMVSNVASNGSTHVSTLTFDQLKSSHEGTYTCEVAVGTTTESVSVNVNVEVPDITVAVIDGPPTAGQSYSLTCTVAGAEKLNPSLGYKWFKMNPETEVGTNSPTLLFSSLRLSDAGRYRCDVSVTSDLLTGRISASSEVHSLTLQIPPPNALNIVTASPDGTIFTGSSLTLTCVVELSEAVDVTVTVNTEWTGPSSGTEFTNTTSVAMSMSNTSSLYISTATLSNVVTSDSGEYNCTAMVGSNPTSPFLTNSSIEVGARKVRDVLRQFQLQLGRTDDCTTWNLNKAEVIRATIHEELLKVIKSRCQCELPEENIFSGVFSCHSSRFQATYRSTIIGTPTYRASSMVDLIQEWVKSEPTLTIQWYTLKLDPNCPVDISNSLRDPECGNLDALYRDDPFVAQFVDAIAAFITRPNNQTSEN